MMKVILTQGEPPVPLWIDITDPTPDELYGLAENYQLHPKLVQDCLEPAHLPKHEKHGDTTFMIIRQYDESADILEDNVQGMTRKLAVFLGERFLISIHRKEQLFLDQFQYCYQNTKKPIYLQVVMLEMLMAAVETYHAPLEFMETQIHGFEASILKNEETRSNWEDVFRTKTRLTIIKRILWHSLDAVQKFVPFSDASLPLRQDLVERIDSLRFFADSLLDDLNALLNIQLSLATHRANDAANKANNVMKVLTIFSAFFLPLNFIVGIYGMNFENMPEIHSEHGYYYVWGALLLTVASIYTWFVKKGWIRWGHLS